MLPISFLNKVAIVTGAEQGIGFEIARQLAIGGASVILNDLDSSLAEWAAGEIRKEKGRYIAAAGDAANVAFVNSMVKMAVDEFDKLDIAIANAGITLFGDFIGYPHDSLERVMRLNLGGSFLLAQAAAKQIINQESCGSIYLCPPLRATRHTKSWLHME